MMSRTIRLADESDSEILSNLDKLTTVITLVDGLALEDDVNDMLSILNDIRRNNLDQRKRPYSPDLDKEIHNLLDDLFLIWNSLDKQITTELSAFVVSYIRNTRRQINIRLTSTPKQSPKENTAS